MKHSPSLMTETSLYSGKNSLVIRLGLKCWSFFIVQQVVPCPPTRFQVGINGIDSLRGLFHIFDFSTEEQLVKANDKLFIRNFFHLIGSRPSNSSASHISMRALTSK